MTLCDAQFIAWSLSRPLHKPKPYIYEYVHRRLRWVWRDVFLFPATHAVEVLQQKCVFRLFWFLPAHWISNDNNDKEVKVLTFSPGCSCSRPYYTNSRAGCAKKKKKGGGGLQFPDSLSNFNVNTLELQLKVSALTSQLRFHLKLERGAWNERKRLHLLIQSDCADGVFMEIHQVCDKNLYLSGQLCHAHRCNEAATRTGSLNSGLKLAPFWHQGCFDPFVCSN